MSEPVGNELDAAVARRVFGLEVLGEAACSNYDGCWLVHPCSRGQAAENGHAWRPVYQDGDDLWTDELGETWNLPLFGRSAHCLRPVPQYSTDPAAAWTVALWLRDRWGAFTLEAGLKWYCFADEGSKSDEWGTGDTMMLAVCRAAVLEAQKRP